jgi:N-acetyl-1-D-myo-inositol-2-amino-2-deoxy-alpha-D-glucopyranoside deacetylase
VSAGNGELRAAAKELGVAWALIFDWIDSGVDGVPAPGSLCAVRLEDVSDTVAGVIDELRPDIVITPDAGDGHRDHAKIRDATLAAVAHTQHRPSQTYLWCLPRSLIAEFTNYATPGTPDHDITTVIDTTEFSTSAGGRSDCMRRRRRRSTRCHPRSSMRP